MNRFGLPAIVLIASAMAAGCGGKQSVASKSAAAYREAVAKGIPVGAGHHGGHANESAESSGMAGMDHNAMPGMSPTTAAAGAQDMSKMPGMQTGSTSGMSNMPGMKHGSMSGMNQSTMQHGSMAGMKDMPGMEHDSMAGMDESKMKKGSMAGMKDMPGTEHGSMAGMSNMAGMAGMHHASTTTTTPVVLGAPTSSNAIAKLSPSSTLQQDQFDRPAPVGESPADHAHHDEGNS